ncbi:3',5'-cyclic adenosine monophosphate phosphodiesterase CpdA [Catellatospora sp. TT07R-123]|uniref:metallophosphoesterase n=1 Tax=Catellatospora sp. TT07R-123 TaxID=2733863 RepID=UPI001B13DAFB|nr:metallophosphoesterase [Catellatospora sp. TT07R-123]GHJ48184.1 3',5'-cyclic adenosine monophosphate phosphodiesterase CpdA [Catellatospora sp. TT07R-123]
MLLLAHISDLHLDGTQRATERALRVMDHLRNLPRPVDAVVVTGDIADHGEISEYEEAARILAAPFPVLLAPGNHDARGPLRKGLLGLPEDGSPVNSVHRVGGAAVLMCDSSIPGRDEGLLDPDTVAWIDRTLSELHDVPAFLAFHHPPVRMHHPLPDSIGLQRQQDLADLLDAHPHVVAVLTGHSHTAAASTFARRPLLVAPAITWTLRLPWEGEGLADLDAPPALAYHVLDDDGSLITHFRVVR